MSTITKELAKLFRKITNSEIDAEGNAHVVLSPADSLLINNARIALASLEVEAVAYMHHSGQVVTQEECCDDKIFAICCKVEAPPYAAPQLPQPAPEEIAMQNFRAAMEGIGHIRRTLEETFGGLHGTHCEPDVLVECKEICDAIHEAYRNSAPATSDCWCRTCRPVTMNDMRFVVCPECGNKRCPHANDHNNACTGSNEPGQAGSAYPAAPQQEVK